MKAIDNEKRKKIETLIYKFFDKLDTTGTNTEKYKEKFSKMNNNEFTKFVSLDFPYRFYTRPFDIEPTMTDIINALKVINVPLTEKLNLPYLYTNKDGVPVQSKECMVLYLHIKKLQQFITKKNSMSTEITNRNMKNGLLIFEDKNAKESDREMESLVVFNLDKTMKELTRHRADSMDAKNAMYNQISNTGKVSLSDAPVAKDDSLSKNMLNTYLIGAHLQSNLLNEDYYLPSTIEERKKKVERL